MDPGARPSRVFDLRLNDDFSVDRLLWIIRLRWIAVAGICAAATVSALGLYPGVNFLVLLGAVGVAAVYNTALYIRHRGGARRGAHHALYQVIVDMGLLTVVLWAAGGMRTPFIGYYVFHVAIVGILGGRRATVVAALAALAGGGLLLVTEQVPWLQIGQWHPQWPWDVLAELVAAASMVLAVAYLVTHAVDELRRRESDLARASDSASLELEVLTNTLDELEAGLEVVGSGKVARHEVLWRNKRAEELAFSGDDDAGAHAPDEAVSPGAHHPVEVWRCPGAARPCEREVEDGPCPVLAAIERREPGRCRFAARIGSEERVVEMQVFPLGPGPRGDARVMNLYLDRTRTLVAERRLLLAERLASLGRVTQGVAHELNTPLATIRTLSADMVAALRQPEEAEGSPAPATGADTDALMADLRESAELVHDETRRLGRITQGLLTGRDLTASRVDGAVPLVAVVERALALVFAGTPREHVTVDDSLARHAVEADPDHLVQVLVNLLANAHDAVHDEGGGGLRVHAQPAGEEVEILVDDDGPGLPASITRRLFEPFATTKPPGKGTGLGLYTSYMLVDAMRGTLTLENRPEGGARAVVRLRAALTGARAERESARPGGVALAGDEP